MPMKAGYDGPKTPGSKWDDADQAGDGDQRAVHSKALHLAGGDADGPHTKKDEDQGRSSWLANTVPRWRSHPRSCTV